VFNGALDTRGDPGSRIAATLGTVGLMAYRRIIRQQVCENSKIR